MPLTACPANPTIAPQGNAIKLPVLYEFTPRVRGYYAFVIWISLFKVQRYNYLCDLYIYFWYFFFFNFDSIIYLGIIHLYTVLDIFLLCQQNMSNNSSGISVQLVVKIVIVVSAVCVLSNHKSYIIKRECKEHSQIIRKSNKFKLYFDFTIHFAKSRLQITFFLNFTAKYLRIRQSCSIFAPQTENK